MESTEETIEWSEKSAPLKEIIRDEKLPILVKVAEGFYNNDNESFSPGDLIRLDGLKCIQKVRADVVSAKNKKMEEIFIPLEYKGKVKITGVTLMEKTFHSVEELIKVFPRYVTVIEAFTSRTTERFSARNVEKGDSLELDRFLEGIGLVCTDVKSGQLLIISTSGQYHLISRPDNNQYTIKEVIDRFPLPQNVTFVDEEVQKLFTTNLDEALPNICTFTGSLKLLGFTTEEVVVGHSKPQTLQKDQGKFVHRNVIMLPTNGEIVKELEVYLAIKQGDKDYEILLSTNVSQSQDMSAVDSMLYVDMVKKPRRMINLKIREEVPYSVPPPKVPPRRKSSAEDCPSNLQKAMTIPRMRDKVGDNDDYILMSDKKGDVDHTDDYEVIDESGAQEIFYKREMTQKSKVKKLVGSIGRKFPSSLKNIFVQSWTPTSSGKEMGKDHANCRSGVKQNYETNLEHIGDLEGGEYTEIVDTTIKPVLVVKPTSAVSPKRNAELLNDESLKNMSVEELVARFRFCKLDRLADLCEKEAFDGNIFGSLTDEQLQSEPFCLRPVDLIKVQSVKNGWRPIFK
ncbi:uncharacterized protein LOC127719215 isoform X1 [Mytilus californianus]|uniref:uncharacterized protein LOC127719215 isoform X1 n=1 Tax=Mytilus californianus TaxID=6549 RepID=UPI0022481FA1|nr:uncharacterized protein LOC127719215 isoform X1 [Mytilus californianus]